MSSGPVAPAGWAPLEVPAYLAPLWGGGHAVVAAALGSYGGAGLGALLGLLRSRGRWTRSRGVRIALLAPEHMAPTPALAAEAAAAVDAALFDPAIVRRLLASGPGAEPLSVLPVLRLGLWFPIIWGLLLLLGSGGRPLEVVVALWLIVGLPACAAWYRRRRLLALLEAAEQARRALRELPSVRVMHHPGLAELRRVIDAAADPVRGYHAAAERCVAAGVPGLERFYRELAQQAEAPEAAPCADREALPAGAPAEAAAPPVEAASPEEGAA